MPQQSSATRQPVTTPHELDDGPLLEHAPPGTDAPDLLSIRARRYYPVSREDLFSTWTRRTAWDSWMRLRARSRSTLAPYRGGAFRLELAEGPTIHVITGTVSDIRPPELLSLAWVHQNANDHCSTLDIAFHEYHDHSVLTLVHGSIASRREAAWLMRLWPAVLRRLDGHLANESPTVQRLPAFDGGDLGIHRNARSDQPHAFGRRIASVDPLRRASSGP